MKHLLITTAVIEIGAGVGLLVCPSQIVKLLLGAPLVGSVALALGRLTGAALCALSVANWLASYDGQSRAAQGVVSAMVLYNLGAVLVLASAGARQQPGGVILWPAVLLHSGMFLWCVTSLLGKRKQETT